MLWSILIPTMPKRQAKLTRLLGILLPQVEAWAPAVEVVGFYNDGRNGVAWYRDRLMWDAQGEYLSYVDDDDLVSPDYVQEIASAMLRGKPDVIGFELDNVGVEGRHTCISVQYQDPPWGPVGGVYYRDFNHLCPVRTEIARKGSFGGGPNAPWSGEDQWYTRTVLPHLKDATDVYIRKTLYTYIWDPNDTTQSGPPQNVGGPLLPRPVVDSASFRWVDS